MFNRAGIFIPLDAPFTHINLTIVLGLISDIASEHFEKVRVRDGLRREDHPDRSVDNSPFAKGPFLRIVFVSL